MSDFTLSAAQREMYDDLGYLIVRQAFSADRVRSLVDAIERMMDRALTGEININWIDKDQRLPGRNGGMLQPWAFDPAFAQWMEEDVIDWLEAVIQEDVRHSLFGMLTGGAGQPNKQGWHRDLAVPGAETEQHLLDWFTSRCVQYNAPLKPDDHYLHVVPGSHKRTSTPEEIAEAAKGETANMPGGIAVELQPGDLAVYNPNIWHRGWNEKGGIRWTMHSAYWKASIPVMSHERGQVEALQTPGFLDKFPPRLRVLMERYIAAHPDTDPVPTTEMAFSGAS